MSKWLKLVDELSIVLRAFYLPQFTKQQFCWILPTNDRIAYGPKKCLTAWSWRGLQSFICSSSASQDIRWRSCRQSERKPARRDYKRRNLRLRPGSPKYALCPISKRLLFWLPKLFSRPRRAASSYRRSWSRKISLRRYCRLRHDAFTRLSSGSSLVIWVSGRLPKTIGKAIFWTIYNSPYSFFSILRWAYFGCLQPC